MRKISFIFLITIMKSTLIFASVYLEPNWVEQKKLMMLDQGRTCILKTDGFKCHGDIKVGDYLPANIRFENPMYLAYHRDKKFSLNSQEAIRICVVDNYILRCFSKLEKNIELPIPEFKDKVYKVDLSINGSDACALSGDSLVCWNWYLREGNLSKNRPPQININSHTNNYTDVINYQNINGETLIYKKDGSILKSQNSYRDVPWFPDQFLSVTEDFEVNDIISRLFAYDSACSYDVFNRIKCLTKKELKNLPLIHEPILELATEYPRYCARTFSKIICWNTDKDESYKFSHHDPTNTNEYFKFIDDPFYHKNCEPKTDNFIECKNASGGIDKILYDDWKHPQICYKSNSPQATCFNSDGKIVNTDLQKIGSGAPQKEASSCRLIDKKISCPDNLELESNGNAYFKTDKENAKDLVKAFDLNGNFCVVEERDIVSQFNGYSASKYWLHCLPNRYSEKQFESVGPIYSNNKVFHLINTYYEKTAYFMKMSGKKFFVFKSTGIVQAEIIKEPNLKIENFINSNANVFTKFFNDEIKIEKVFLKNDEYCFFFDSKDLACSFPFLEKIKVVDDITFNTRSNNGDVCIIQFKNKVRCWSWKINDKYYNSNTMFSFDKINYFPNDTLALSDISSGKSFNFNSESLKPLIESSTPLYANYYQDLYNYYVSTPNDFQNYFGTLILMSAIETAITENTSKLYLNQFTPEFISEHDRFKHLTEHTKFYGENDLRVIFRILLITIKSTVELFPSDKRALLNELRSLAVQAYQKPTRENISKFTVHYELMENQLQSLEQNSKSYFLYKNFLTLNIRLNKYLAEHL